MKLKSNKVQNFLANSKALINIDEINFDKINLCY